MDLSDLDDVLDFFESSSDAGPSSKKKSSKNTQPNKYTKPSTNTKSQAGSTGPGFPDFSESSFAAPRYSTSSFSSFPGYYTGSSASIPASIPTSSSNYTPPRSSDYVPPSISTSFSNYAPPRSSDFVPPSIPPRFHKFNSDSVHAGPNNSIPTYIPPNLESSLRNESDSEACSGSEEEILRPQTKRSAAPNKSFSDEDSNSEYWEDEEDDDDIEHYTFPADGTKDDPLEFDFLRQHAYDPHREDKLCRICRQIDIADLIRKPARSLRIILGTVSELRGRAGECVVCRVIVDSETRSPDSDQQDVILVRRDRKGVQTIEFTRIDSDGNMTIMLHLQDGSQWKVRRVGKKYDPAMLRKWLEDCDQTPHHPIGQRQGQKAASNSAVKGSSQVQTSLIKRFIDVRKECVVDAATFAATLTGRSQPRRYAALSYVWGREPQKVLLTHASQARLHQPGSLAADKLPKTIRHAIKVCKDLDIPLLWVDALCIRQDGALEQDQLSIMHDVYAGAAFTIVALGGDSVHAGLGGVSSDDDGGDKIPERGASFFTQGVKFVIQPDDLGEALSGSYWATRGWTFQEFLLARRRIIFSDRLVYFTCPHGSFQEDRIADHAPGPSKFRGNHSIDWDGSVNWPEYSSLVTEYCSKNLTNETDFFIAFNGILDALKRSGFTKSFTWGLPESHFPKALSWYRVRSTPAGSESRGKVILPLADGDSSRNDDAPMKAPPSWSWMSLRGGVLLACADSVERINYTTNLTRAGFNLELEADVATFTVARPEPDPSDLLSRLALERDDCLRILGAKRGNPWCGFVFEDYVIPNLPKRISFVKISQSPIYERPRNPHKIVPAPFPGPGKDNTIHMARSIQQLSQCHCGVAFLEAGGDSQKSDEFSTAFSLSELNEVDRMLGVRVFNHSAYDPERPWPVYNVLMIEWLNDKTAIRRGFGQIHVDAFDEDESFKCRRFRLV